MLFLLNREFLKDVRDLSLVGEALLAMDYPVPVSLNYREQLILPDRLCCAGVLKIANQCVFMDPSILSDSKKHRT